MGKSREPDTSELIRLLESRGYIAKKKRNYVKRTFDIDSELLNEVTQIRESEGLQVREVFTEALQLWIEKRQGAKAPPKATG
jgi:hypothetical protein